MIGLNDLLRAELTAVNQQFIHVLALNRLGHEAIADRVYEVDVVDFPNAMRIIDHLMASGRDVLTAADAADDATRSLFAAAAAPRPAYQAWLTEMRAQHREPALARGDPAIDPLFACLIAALEHRMLRAFAAWRAGDAAEADRAWAMSGMAMVQATDLVNALTDLGAVPLASGAHPAALPARLGDHAVERDLMDAYAGAAQAAAQQAASPLRDICCKIADYTRAVQAWRPETPHPAPAACAPSFRSFAATYRKFVQPSP
jgi:hypothetical protein